MIREEGKGVFAQNIFFPLFFFGISAEAQRHRDILNVRRGQREIQEGSVTIPFLREETSRNGLAGS